MYDFVTFTDFDIVFSTALLLQNWHCLSFGGHSCFQGGRCQRSLNFIRFCGLRPCSVGRKERIELFFSRSCSGAAEAKSSIVDVFEHTPATTLSFEWSFEMELVLRTGVFLVIGQKTTSLPPGRRIYA